MPEMRRYKYDLQLATGCIAAGGGLGMLIPPSIVFIVSAILTEQSIGKLFIAGVVPGLMIALFFCAVVFIQCRRHPQLGPAGPVFSWRQKFAALKGIWETLLLFALVMGGMFRGFSPQPKRRRSVPGRFTDHCVLQRGPDLAQALPVPERNHSHLLHGDGDCGRGDHFWQIPCHYPGSVNAGLLAHRIAFARLVHYRANRPFYLFGGCFLDALALDILTIPIFYPVVQALGYDVIWFGVMIVVATMMGVITPPVGVCVYVVSGMARDVPLEKIYFKALFPSCGR